MRRIERYLAAEVMRPAGGTLIGLVVVVLVFYASRILAQAVAEGFSIVAVTQLALLRLGIFMDVLVPAALVLGVVIGLGRLQTGHELTALAALGAGRYRILSALALPVLGLALLVAGVSLLYRPWAFATLYGIEAEVAARLDLSQVEPGRFTPLGRAWLLFAEGRDGDNLERVLVHRRGDDGGGGVLRAGRVHQEGVRAGRQRLVFTGGVEMFQPGTGGSPDVVGRFQRLEVVFTPPPPPVRERLRRALPFGELRQGGDPVYLAELQRRLLGPLSVPLLALAGLALGRIDTRRGQSTRVLGATLVVVLYFSVLGVLMEGLERGQLAPWPGLFWLPLAAIGLLLSRYWVAHRGPGVPL
ncbi:MAG: LptF/LptG family permease [Gammaproteobacteria bacterium]|nr:LptF/LptG family permease [Gammaproteobacteria bacterium]